MVESSRIAREVHYQFISQEGGIAFRALCKGTEEDIASILAEGPRLDVLHNADDLVGNSSPGNALADGILPGEESFCKGLIDDSDFGSVGGLVSEVTTRDAWNPHGFEIAGRGHKQLYARIGTGGRR
jgi:hypothetical protein